MGTNIKKALLTMEDIAAGAGTVKQVRNDQEMELHLVDVPLAVSSEAALAGIDTSKFTYARVGNVDYRYSDTAQVGVKSSFGAGYWLKVRVPLDAVASTALPDAADFPHVQLALTDPDGKPSPVVISTGVKWVYLDNSDV